MELTWPVALAVLGAALLHASWNVLLKSGEDKEHESIGVGIGSGLVALAVAPFLPVPASGSWPWLVGSAIVHILYFLFLAGAYRWGELSYTYPVMRGGGPMIVAVAGALAFDELLTPGQTLGVLLVCAGILAFAAGRHHPRATGFAIANAGVIATYTLIDGYGARASGAPVSYALWFFAANGIVLALYTAARGRGRSMAAYFRAKWPRALIGGTLAIGAYGIALWAMARAPIALVAVLRETSVIFAALLGALFLKEKMTHRRLVATGAVMVGLVALRF